MPFPPPHSGTYYTDFLAYLSVKREVGTYFEIGVEKGINLSGITAEHAIGVDPFFNLEVDVTKNKQSISLYRMTSDKFFKACPLTRGIEMAFLDGMHVFEFLLRDFYHTERQCSENAVIFLHDCMPFGEEMVSRQSQGGAWTGDVWKIVPILQKHRPDLKLTLIDCAPTGLVALSRLDPTSTILQEKYDAIVAEFAEMPNNGDGASTIYQNNYLHRAVNILNHNDHSLYFRL